VAGRDVVATNAHVVAGDPEPGVRTADGRKLAATVTVFDRVDDIAVLAVPGLDLPSLALGAPPRFGAPVAILGHPGGGPLEAAPATVGDRGEGLRPDPVTARRLPGRWLNVRGHAEPGSSGSPILNRNGRVVAMVWGGAEGAASIAAVPTADIRAALLATRRTAPERCSP
jgi:S1-C subfamily serine protease